MRYALRIGIFTWSLIIVVATNCNAEFALNDGDTVVFLGDSITAAQTYGKIIENCTLLRFPDRKVRFFNAGWGGDTAAGGLARLNRDVFDRAATVLIVAYGVNDIGWGVKADSEHRQRYLDSIRGIVDRCKERGVRVFIGSAAITAEDPSTSETGFLQKMCDAGMSIARERGEAAIDIQRAMREIQRRVMEVAKNELNPKDKPTLHASDGVHLNDLGQFAMAFAILKGLGAPKDVSSVEINVQHSDSAHASGCVVRNLVSRSNRVEFDRLDEGLPINFGIFGALQFRYVPIPDELNRYSLSIRELPVGRYSILADGRELGAWTSDQLANGVNLSSATANPWEPGGPWDVRAGSLIRLTNARSDAIFARREFQRFLPGDRENPVLNRETDALTLRIEELQRAVARPRPFHFLVRPMESGEARASKP